MSATVTRALEWTIEWTDPRLTSGGYRVQTLQSIDEVKRTLDALRAMWRVGWAKDIRVKQRYQAVQASDWERTTWTKSYLNRSASS